MEQGLGDLLMQAFAQPAQPSPYANSNPDPMFGYGVRQPSSSEQQYFQGNPNVAGMASDSGHVVLNPSPAPGVNQQSVALNEAARLLMRDRDVVPNFDLTGEQRGAFAGTPYAGNDPALKQSIAARVYAGDPSARATPEQAAWGNALKTPGPAPTAHPRPGGYNTQLSPLDEMAFRQWVAKNNVPFDPNAPVTDYDMRGFYQGMQQQNPHARSGVDPKDQRMHYSDYWKTPMHRTFSQESQWAGPVAPRWDEQGRLIAPSGRILQK